MMHTGRREELTLSHTISRAVPDTPHGNNAESVKWNVNFCVPIRFDRPAGWLVLHRGFDVNGLAAGLAR